MVDLIDRQQAIDALYNVDEYNQRSVIAIKNLPSIQTDTTTHDSIPAETGKNDGDKTSGDCISRQMAINEAERWLYDGDDNRTIGEMLRDLPSVQPEIIRCKDCLIHGVCRFEQGLGLNGYCSQAKRRTNG